MDLYIVSSGSFAELELNRRTFTPLLDEPQQNIYLASAEDTILHKLQWFQQSGGVSDKQWSDILGVLEVRANTLDYSYLEESAKQRGISEFLDKALKEVETQ